MFNLTFLGRIETELLNKESGVKSQSQCWGQNLFRHSRDREVSLKTNKLVQKLGVGSHPKAKEQSRVEKQWRLTLEGEWETQRWTKIVENKTKC